MQFQLRRIPYLCVIALLVYMPLHVFLAQSLSLITGGLEVWKIGKDVLLALAAVFAICLVIKQRSTSVMYLTLLTVTAVYGLMHLALWAAHPHLYARSAELGVIYNLRVPLLALLGWSAAVLYPEGFAWRRLLKLVLGISTVVAALGVLQYFLPKDLLTHFGYSLDRGVRPAFFIDNNPAFPRVMATLRDPNSLGAYLLLPVAALVSLLLRVRDAAKRYIVIGALALHLLCIYLTFSRSAWAGVFIVAALVVWWQYRGWFTVQLKRFWPLVAAVALIVVIAGYMQRHNSSLNGVVSHTTDQQVGQYDSNQYHFIFMKRGLNGIWHQPLGHGPGTAGLASIQNPAGSFLTENYYVQIGYEVGVLGLGVFVAMNVWLYLKLMRQKTELSHVLLASFWAYVLVNMLLHMWSNEAVAAQWWLLAGLAMGLGAGKQKHAQKVNTR